MEKSFERNQSFLPAITHTEDGCNGTTICLTVRDAIGNLSPLDGLKGRNENKKFHPWHFAHVR